MIRDVRSHHVVSAMTLGAETGPHLRSSLDAELAKLRVQVDEMAQLVNQALDQMRRVMSSADTEAAARALAGDDKVDAMMVTVSEHCYDLICRQAPVASDLRLIISVIRVTEELERIGDLSLRVVKQGPVLAEYPQIQSTLNDMATVAIGLYKSAMQAWSTQDLDLATTLAVRDRAMDAHYADLLTQLLELRGERAAEVAIAAVLTGRAMDRIADHTVVVGERLRYMLTADPSFLASEIR
ncbi:MAG: phosphate signaling complex protein PhoU [Actinomycetota bacterium]